MDIGASEPLASSASAPMSTDSTPPASQAQSEAQHSGHDSRSEARIEPSSERSSASLRQDERNSSRVQGARQNVLHAANGDSQSVSPDSGSADALTSPTLTENASPDAPNTDLSVTRLKHPRRQSQHSLDQSDDAHSAVTSVTFSDDGTVHTSETSSGKSKALADNEAAGSVFQKLPNAIIDRILFYVRQQMPRFVIPAAVRDDITPVAANFRVIIWLMHSWGMNWLFPLRTVCSNLSKAVRRNPLWEDYIIALTQARRERANQRTLQAPFISALQLQRSLCFSCSLTGSTYDARSTLTSQFGACLSRFVPICEVHEAALTASEDSPLLCSNCFLDDQRFFAAKTPDGRDTFLLRDDVDIAYIDDDERFPQAESVCSSCRTEAFIGAVHAEDPTFGRFLPQLRNTLAFHGYVWQAEGTGTEAARSAIEQLWLEHCTEYPQLVKHAQLQKRRERMKRAEAQREMRRQQRELMKVVIPPDRADSTSELSEDEDDQSEVSIHFEDEDANGNVMLNLTEDRFMRDRAWHDWCRHRLDAGLWRSVYDQSDVELPNPPNLPGPVPPRIMASGFTARPGEEARPSNGSIVVETLPLPPPTLYHKACRIWDEVALPEFFKLPLSNIVEILKAREDGFELSLEMDFARLFTWLKKPEAWLPPQQLHPHPGSAGGATVLASRLMQPPRLPYSVADVGPGTVARIMEIWKRVCAPLAECDCSICRRQKRKRSHDESKDDTTQRAQAPATTAAPPGPIVIPAQAGAQTESDMVVDLPVEQRKGQEAQREAGHLAGTTRDEAVDDSQGPRKVARVEAPAAAP
ncbi:hypothetical protein V8E36_003217 [Tilletia maclaganii]